MSCFIARWCAVFTPREMRKPLHERFVASAALICLLALGVGGVNHASAEEAAGGAELQPVRPALEELDSSAETEQARQIWVTPGDAMGEPGTEVIVEHQDRYPASEPIMWTCHVASEAVFRDTEVQLEIMNREDEPVLRGAVSFQRREGRNPTRFRWDPRDLEPGVYTARVTLAPRPGAAEAWQELTLFHYAPPEIAAGLAAGREAVGDLHEHVEAMAAQPGAYPYARMRLALLEEFAEYGQQRLDAGDNPYGAYILDYLEHGIERVRGRLLFSTLSPEHTRPAPLLAELGPRPVNGYLALDGAPAFLFGAAGGIEMGESLDQLTAYGFNFAALELDDPGASGPSTGEVERIRDLLDKARAADINLSLRLPPPFTEDEDGAEIDEFSASTLIRRIEAWRRLGTAIRNAPALATLGLQFTPPFEPESSEFREGFLNYLESVYEDRHEANRAWQTRLRSMDEVELWWDSERSVYQYDLQTYYQQRVFDMFAQLEPSAREVFPESVLELTLPKEAFTEGGTRRGLDREALGPLFDVMGAEAANRLDHSRYAMEHPGPLALYTLLRSFAPTRPLLNLEHSVLSSEEPLRGRRTARYARTVLWEGAMAGLSGSALTGWDREAGSGEYGVAQRPDFLEGYIAAGIDLNRLGPIVEAFRSAHAPVAILWSMPSAIFDDGSPYLESALRALEGISFSGYHFRFISEDQCAAGDLDDVGVLVIPQTLAVSGEAFAAIKQYVDDGGMVVRTGTLIPYDAQGQAQRDVLSPTRHTLALRGQDTPANYLQAMDAAYSQGHLRNIPRATNPFGYPLEGVRSRFIRHEGQPYLYLVNLRPQPVQAHIYGRWTGGRDLIRGRDVTFPRPLRPLEPMLIRLEDRLTVPEGADEEMDVWQEEPALVGTPLDEEDLMDEAPSTDLRPVGRRD
ncbi:MAG: hypothetical protein ACLFU6_03855 [Candidatus Hydrogenedentota bacterium]